MYTYIRIYDGRVSGGRVSREPRFGIRQEAGARRAEERFWRPLWISESVLENSLILIKVFVLKSRVFALLGAKALDFGAKPWISPICVLTPNAISSWIGFKFDRSRPT